MYSDLFWQGRRDTWQAPMKRASSARVRKRTKHQLTTKCSIEYTYMAAGRMVYTYPYFATKEVKMGRTSG